VSITEEISKSSNLNVEGEEQSAKSKLEIEKIEKINNLKLNIAGQGYRQQIKQIKKNDYLENKQIDYSKFGSVNYSFYSESISSNIRDDTREIDYPISFSILNNVDIKKGKKKKHKSIVYTSPYRNLNYIEYEAIDLSSFIYIRTNLMTKVYRVRRCDSSKSNINNGIQINYNNNDKHKPDDVEIDNVYMKNFTDINTLIPNNTQFMIEKVNDNLYKQNTQKINNPTPNCKRYTENMAIVNNESLSLTETGLFKNFNNTKLKEYRENKNITNTTNVTPLVNQITADDLIIDNNNTHINTLTSRKKLNLPEQGINKKPTYIWNNFDLKNLSRSKLNTENSHNHFKDNHNRNYSSHNLVNMINLNQNILTEKDNNESNNNKSLKVNKIDFNEYHNYKKKNNKTLMKNLIELSKINPTNDSINNHLNTSLSRQFYNNYDTNTNRNSNFNNVNIELSKNDLHNHKDNHFNNINKNNIDNNELNNSKKDKTRLDFYFSPSKENNHNPFLDNLKVVKYENRFLTDQLMSRSSKKDLHTFKIQEDNNKETELLLKNNNKSIKNDSRMYENFPANKLKRFFPNENNEVNDIFKKMDKEKKNIRNMYTNRDKTPSKLEILNNVVKSKRNECKDYTNINESSMKLIKIKSQTNLKNLKQDLIEQQNIVESPSHKRTHTNSNYDYMYNKSFLTEENETVHKEKQIEKFRIYKNLKNMQVSQNLGLTNFINTKANINFEHVKLYDSKFQNYPVNVIHKIKYTDNHPEINQQFKMEYLWKKYD